MTRSGTTVQSTPRHQPMGPHSAWRLSLKWLTTFRWHLFGLYLSDLGRSLVRRKYDAFTTDNGYRSQPVGANIIERGADRIVRKRDTHVALRQRLDLVTSELVETALAQRTASQMRIVSGPVGLGRDLRDMWARLEALGAAPADWLEVAGVDLDATGTVLAEASRLASDRGVPLETHRVDLLDPSGVGHLVGGRADLFNCIGLSTWLDERSLTRLLVAIGASLTDQGALIIDHWRRHDGSKYVNALEMPARYVTDSEFELALAHGGFRVEQKRATANGVVVVYRARPHG